MSVWLPIEYIILKKQNKTQQEEYSASPNLMQVGCEKQYIGPVYIHS